MLIAQWEGFVADRPELGCVRYTSPERDSYARLRTIYDIADCVNLGTILIKEDCKSLGLHRTELMVTLLYIVTRRFYLGLTFNFLKFEVPHL